MGQNRDYSQGRSVMIILVQNIRGFDSMDKAYSVFFSAREIFWTILLDIDALICIHICPICYLPASSAPLLSGNKIYTIKTQFYYKEEENYLIVTYLLKVFVGV